MLETKTTRIGVHQYKVTELDAVLGRRVFVRLLKIAGPALAKLEGGLDEGALASALTDLLTRLEPSDFDYFCDTFASVTEVSGGKYSKTSPQLDDVFSLHFASNYLDMFAWLAFCLKLNFASFFSGAAQLLGQLAASRSASPKESTGGSGD